MVCVIVMRSCRSYYARAGTAHNTWAIDLRSSSRRHSSLPESKESCLSVSDTAGETERGSAALHTQN